MGQEGPKSRLPAQACGPLARPRPPLRAGRAFQQFLPARPPGLCPDGAQPAHPRGHGFGLRRPWPRALRMPEGFRGSRPCLGSPFQGPVPVPTAWPHPLNHFCTRRQAFLPTLPRRSEGAAEGGGNRAPHPNCSWLRQGLSRHPWPQRHLPAFVSLCPPQERPHPQPSGSPAAGRRLSRLPTKLLAGESGRPSPQTPCAPLPSPGRALTSTSQ